MKAIRARNIRSFPLALTVLAVSEACDGTSAAQHELMQADAEAFEAVVRSQLVDSLPSAFGFLRVDARPGGDNAILAGASGQPRVLELPQPADSELSDSVERIRERRVDILKTLNLRPGGPFFYPECGGARRGADSATPDIKPKCPRELHRYVTVGIPYRGAAPILDKVRSPQSPAPDSSAEMWTVLVTEASVSPGGQQWRQYAWLFKRDPDDGRLAVTERFLLSWAE
jgi:hypothetical protein